MKIVFEAWDFYNKYVSGDEPELMNNDTFTHSVDNLGERIYPRVSSVREAIEKKLDAPIAEAL